MLIKSVLSTLLFGAFVFGSVVAGARIEGRSARRRRAIPGDVKVEGLDILKSYVCAPSANTVKRQLDITSGSTSISIPIRDLQVLWLELQLLLIQITKILEAQGISLSPLLSVPGATIVQTVGGVAQTTTIPATSASAFGIVKTTSSTNANSPTTNSSPSPKPSTSSSPLAGVVIQTTAKSNSPAQSTSVAANQPATTPAPQNSPGTSVVGGITMIGAVSTTSTADDVCWDSTMPVQQAVQTAMSVATVKDKGGIFFDTSADSRTSLVTSGYVFNSQSTKNIAVYFGQTPATSGSSLVAQCADVNIDIVILSFILQDAYQGSRYPQVNFGAACGGQTPAMIASAPGLLYCPDLAAMISTCQKTYGKKILLSIGGATSAFDFTSSTQASDFGTVLWQLFGPPGNIDAGLRPFGNVTIDGFDFDSENRKPTNINVLGTTLRTAYLTDPSKSYYLTAAPQCPFPDESIPLTLLQICDFVFVQFYNNQPCEIGSGGFNDSLTKWAAALQASTSAVKPRLYVGAPAWSPAGASAYANIGSPKGMQSIAKQSHDSNPVNFGGVMFWDGPEGMLNVEGGKDIIAWAKSGLTS